MTMALTNGTQPNNNNPWEKYSGGESTSSRGLGTTVPASDGSFMAVVILAGLLMSLSILGNIAVFLVTSFRFVIFHSNCRRLVHF